jgi:hypothetical protein
MNRSFLTFTVLILISTTLLFGLYTWGTLNWVYSSGDRVGYVQKMSHKGYLCKTWEGEMVLISMPGTQAEKFYFTVRDEAVVNQINHLLGEHVHINYTEHKGIPSSCFGETDYFVEKIEKVEK